MMVDDLPITLLAHAFHRRTRRKERDPDAALICSYTCTWKFGKRVFASFLFLKMYVSSGFKFSVLR